MVGYNDLKNEQIVELEAQLEILMKKSLQRKEALERLLSWLIDEYALDIQAPYLKLALED